MQQRAAAARALNDRVWLSWKPQAGSLAMSQPVMGDAGRDFQVLRPVVGLIAVDVMDLLSRQKPPAENLLGNQAVFVSVPANVCQVVIKSDLDQHVAVRRQNSPALPLAVFFSRLLWASADVRL